MLKKGFYAALLLGLVHLLACCASEPEQAEPAPATVEETRTYVATGTIVRFLPDGRHVRIDHAEIPGFMEAMTMSFAVEDTLLLRNVAEGDSVRFTLTVRGEKIVLSEMARLEAR